MTWTKDKLIAFEQRVADAFLAKQIKAPVHLSGGNEEQLVEVFKEVRPGDWVFSTWRSHYHALLKGAPEQWVWDEILAGRSMYLMNREHRFFSSAIVGGALPMALGIAWSIKQEFRHRSDLGIPPRVWVFVGDMCARSGLFHEFYQYVAGHALPVKMVVEDNGLSTDTPTQFVWGNASRAASIRHYEYQRTWPHVGVGKHVAF